MRELIDILQVGRKAILVHSNADPDALGSAYALATTFPEADIYAPGGLDRSGKALQAFLGIEVLENYEPDAYELTVVVDTSSPEQLHPAKVPPGSVVIDHHRPNGKWEGMMYHCDDTRSSCAEIVLDIIEAAGRRIDREVAMALMVGMLTDSGHFQYGNAALMHRFASLMEAHGIAADEVMGVTRAQTGMSEKAAILKGVSRSRFDRLGRYIVAVSYGSSYESSICRALLNCGADVAYVGSQRDERFRISARCSQDIVREGLHLGQILDELGGETSTEGGGHGGAAGMTGTGDVEAMLHMCMKKTMSRFREFRDRSAPQ